ncbi:MAG: gamma-glutamylcyclotransferase [Neomegalonema sp.]|nr:gamma-glutamylcyclotransferase [Neomegalonema sp.]
MAQSSEIAGMPTCLFFYGSLRDEDLLYQITRAAPGSLTLTPAYLPFYHVRRVAGESFPMIFPDPDDRTDGVLLSGLSDEQRARIAYFEDSDYRLEPHEVITDAGPVRAGVYQPTAKLRDSGEPWDFAAWQAQDKALLLECAAEQQSYFGTVPQALVELWWPDIKARAASRLAAKGTPVPAEPSIRQTFTRADVEPIKVDEIYREYFAMEDHYVRFRTYAGAMSQEVKRGLFITGEAVTILPYDPVRDELVLIEQWRVGPWAFGDANPWTIEVVAGRLDGDTSAEITARREAEEEAGVEISHIEPIGRYYTTPGISTEVLNSFIGCADLSAAGGVHGLEEEGENIRVLRLPYWEAIEAMHRGEVNSGPAILSLVALARQRDRLRMIWR